MSGSVPSQNFPVVDADGRLTIPWHRYLTQAASQPAAADAVTPAASPFTYTAPARGSVLVKGGTVSNVALTRGRVSAATGLSSGFFPVGAGDSVTITYSVAPELHFFAS